MDTLASKLSESEHECTLGRGALDGQAVSGQAGPLITHHMGVRTWARCQLNVLCKPSSNGLRCAEYVRMKIGQADAGGTTSVKLACISGSPPRVTSGRATLKT